MSPDASSATTSAWLSAAVNEYQTEFLMLPQSENGSSASTVASSVVARTCAGSVIACGAVRRSFGGGAASAGAAQTSAKVPTSRVRAARMAEGYPSVLEIATPVRV